MKSQKMTSKKKIQEIFPSIVMMEKNAKVPHDEKKIFYFICKNYIHEIKNCTNEKRIKLFKEGIQLPQAKEALNHYGFDKYCIIRNIENDEVQLMMTSDKFDPDVKKGQFEVIFDEFDTPCASDTVSETNRSERSISISTQSNAVVAPNPDDVDAYPYLGAIASNKERASPTKSSDEPHESSGSTDLASTSESMDEPPAFVKKFIFMIREVREQTGTNVFVNCTRIASQFDEDDWRNFYLLFHNMSQAHCAFQQHPAGAEEPPDEVCVQEA